MKKKIFLLLFVFLFSVTGCVKYNGVMEIKKDKSMNMVFSYGLDTSIFGSQELVNDEDKAKYRDMGYVVSDYIDGNYKGITVSKHIKNIDSVSNNSDVDYSLSNLLNEQSNNSYIFKVKKGFFKNTYFAKFVFDGSDSNLTDTDDYNDLISDDEVITDEDSNSDEIITDEDLDSDEVITDEDLNLFNEGVDEIDLSNLDLSFNVKLPYSVIRSNASSTNNNGKDLTWNLNATGVNSIEFDFSVYNLSNILLVVGGLVLFIIIIILLIIFINRRKKRRRNNISVDTTSEIPELSSIGDSVQPFSEQSFNRQLMSQNQGVDGIVSDSTEFSNSYNNQSFESNSLNSSSDVEDLSQIDIIEPILDVEDGDNNQSVLQNPTQMSNVQQNVSSNELGFQDSNISMIPNNMFNNDLDSNGGNIQNNN